MKRELRYYQIKPSVVPADDISKIEIRAIEENYAFKDGEKYTVEITPYAAPNKPYSDEYLLFDAYDCADKTEVTAKNGALTFEHLFYGEQKWRIRIFAGEKTNGHTMEMYSLKPDLYELRPYKGDLHLHTNHSDGLECPETVAANYRKAGYDFIAITDHHKYTAAQVANTAYAGLATNFVIYNGEEVHNNHMGQMHVVNFDSASSVNELILNDRENTLAEIEEIKNSPELEGAFDKTDIAWRIWTYRKIKESGGLAIFAHPYWDVCNMEHSTEETVNYVFKNGLMDVFEIFGGCTHSGNNLQSVLYHEMRAQGYDYPIVASTDAHSSLEHGVSEFAIAYTVAFAENAAAIRKAVEKGYTVGVQNEKNQLPNISGKLRFSKYASFLIDNYFPLHDELCFAAGMLMKKYSLDRKKDAKAACETVETYIKELENEFFGA